MLKALLTVLCVLLLKLNLSAQDNSVIPLPHSYISIIELIKVVEQQSDYFVAYNPNHIDTTAKVQFYMEVVDLETIQATLKQQLDLDVVYDNKSRNINIYRSRPSLITGIVRDKSSSESLTAVSIFTSSKTGTYTNEDGYYALQLESDIDSIYFSYLGYQTVSISISSLDIPRLNIDLESDNELSTILIEADSAHIEVSGPIPTNIDKVLLNKTVGLGGRNDLLSSVKHVPGVSVGSEAQTGFIVRGGSPDQNLILIDGLPIYASSHLGGLSSIFLTNSIKNAELFKGGIPARYGGKLSSVLNVRLNDGNRKRTKRSVAINLESINGFIEGPIGKNTSIVLNARGSILNSYIEHLLPREYGQADLSYNDIYSKLSHWFNPSNRLSLTYYRGSDNIELLRQEDGTDIAFTDYNKINWENSLLAVNWNVVLSDKIFFHSHIGQSNFYFGNQSANQVSNLTDNTTSSLDISTNSTQKDLIAQGQLEMFLSNRMRLLIGIGNTRHESNPAILEQQSFLASEQPEGNLDSTYYSNEQFLFLESKIKLSTSWHLNLGLRANHFTGLDTIYNILQPRVDLSYRNNSSLLSFSYSKMSQFFHLLVNPSSGLPNDLWVPSTSTIAPETSNLFSISYRYQQPSKWSLGLAAFYNEYDNLIEYRNAYELIQLIVQDHTPYNWDINERSWEDRVTSGTGRSYGIELDFNYKSSKWEYLLSYTLSRSERSFNFGQFSDNTIDTYLHKYDRPHNIASTIVYKLDDKSSITCNWVFGNGNLWTFTKDTEPNIGGGVIFVAKERNNERLSSYHKLDLAYKRTRKLGNGQLDYTLGIYNLYNNRNPFYGYIKENPIDNPQAFSLREISLYPILPQINVSYTW